MSAPAGTLVEAENRPSPSAADALDVEQWNQYHRAFAPHTTRLLRVATLLLDGRRDDAEDLVHDVFLSCHDAWADGRVDDLGAYLRRAITNGAMSHGRHQGVVHRYTTHRRGDDRGWRAPDDHVTDNVTLRDALAELAPRQRAAVVLRYYEDLSVAETADILDVTDGTVKSQVSDALRHLRRALEED